MAEVSEQIIAYIDILGYKELIREIGENELLRIIQEAIKDTKYEAVNQNGIHVQFLEKEIEIKFNVFSDNFVFYVESSNDIPNITKLVCILTFISRLQAGFLQKYRLTTRGAVVMGNFFADENLVFGQALVNAYELESKIAIYPRVIIDKKCIELYRQYRPANPAATKEEFFNTLSEIEIRANEWSEEQIIGALRYIQVNINGIGWDYTNSNDNNADDIADALAIINAVNFSEEDVKSENLKNTTSRCITIFPLAKRLCEKYSIKFLSTKVEAYDLFWHLFASLSEDGTTFVNFLSPKTLEPHKDLVEKIKTGVCLSESQLKVLNVEKTYKTEHYINDMKACGEILKNGLEKYSTNERVFQKYAWLANYYNATCTRYSLAGMEITHNRVSTFKTYGEGSF